MKKIYWMLLTGLLCPFLSHAQPADLVLSSAESGRQVHLATNNITFNPGYSYTPDGNSMVARIVKPEIKGSTIYPSAINPSTYAIDPSLDAGSLQGYLNVNGSSSYSIPLDCPKGINGLQASINLNYTSSFNDGLLGVGWSIGGISAITRTNETLYHDNKSDPVRGDLTDKYALDGRRLIVINGGTYGVANSEYRTEIEEFSKVIAKGSTGYGPASFTVYTKSGLIYEFGATSDSKITKTNGCILSWKVNKITDRYGNCITFSYLSSNDEQPIGMISYTGNSSLSKTPASQIIFNYKNRSDVTHYYFGGKEFVRDILLDNIEIVNNGKTYKDYVFEYMKDTYSQIQKVTEYSSYGNAINPTVFTWTKQTEQFAQPTYYSSSSDEYYFIGDYNGDGKDDLVTVPVKSSYTSSDKWKLYLADSNGNMVYTNQGSLNSHFEKFLVGDIDGDGMTDLVMIEGDPTVHLPDKGYCYSYKSTGNNFVRNTHNYLTNDKNGLCLVDYNGDGKKEIFNRSYGVYSLHDYNGTLILSSSIPDFGDYYIVDNGLQTRILDFNGDGCTDVLTLFDDGYKIYEFKGTSGKLTETYSESNIDNKDFIMFGDYNGDGTIDIFKAVSPNTYTNRYIMTLTSSGFESRQTHDFDGFDINRYNNRMYSRDMNGDGKTDIILVGRGTNLYNNYNRINIAISNGENFNNIIENTSLINMVWSVDDLLSRHFNFGDFNGDGRSQLFYKYGSTSRLFSFANGMPSHLLSTVIDGLGTKSTISYLPMSNSSVYTRGSGATYPVNDFSSGYQLVSEVSSDNGIGGTTTMSYHYNGAKVHRQGKGFMGFTQVTATNSATGISTENHYEFDGTYYFPKLRYVYNKRGTATLSTTDNTWNVTNLGGVRIFPYISPVVETDNLTGLTVTTTASYNSYGNPMTIEKDYGSGHTQTTAYSYNNELISSWLIGRPTTITKTSVREGETKIFTTSRTYFSTNNSPDIDNYNTGDNAWWKLDRAYDGFGNLSEVKKETTGLSSQTTVYTYDPDYGVNLMTVTDPVGNETDYTYDPTLGKVKTITDPLGNVVTYNYNNNDRLSSIVPINGIVTTIVSGLDVSGGPAHARYYVQKSGDDGSLSKIWYDKLGRELRTESKIFGGSMVKVDKQYNAKGQLFQVSEPSTGTPSNWNISSYDDYGRIYSRNPYYGLTTTYTYDGAKVTQTMNGRSYTSTVDAAGLSTQRTDPGGTITYAYWPDGTLKSTTAPGAITTEMFYDKNGNRLTIDDPSAGLITNTYYGTGQPNTVRNADTETTTYHYQPNGLLDYYDSEEGITDYSYNAENLVESISSPGGVSRSYTYDDGKIKTITESIGGISNLVTFDYDTKGRLYRKYYNGNSDYEEYDYDTNSGQLYRIQFSAGGTTSTVWQLTGMDEYGHITNSNIGNTAATWSYDNNKLLSGIAASGVQDYDYSFDVNTGNLNWRKNYLKSKTESFGYDSNNLDRLETITGPVNGSVSYTDDKNGNIYTKSDAGTYVYGNTPYAVSSISNAQNISTTPQSIDYYSFEKVQKITEGTKTADFDYNADHQRIRMILKNNGTITKTRWYFGHSCEREQIGSTTTQYIWIGGDAYTAVAVAKKVGTGNWTVYNIFRDHLGTITHLKTGSTISEYSFDAWGRRRDKDDWTYTLSSEPSLFADRGFTAHEYLEDFKLYNMNGRMYDPVVGRFLSPDPYIQMPNFSQNFNRYSYCLNNPLKYYDPTGGKWKWFNPIYWFGELMQTINDNTEKLRDKMADAGIPDFGVGLSISGEGTVPYASVAVVSGMDMSVGYNISSGQLGIGNNSSGFHQFYYPSKDYAAADKNALQSIAYTRQIYGDAWIEAQSQGDGWHPLMALKEVGSTASYASGAIGLIQIGMLEYRMSLPIMSKIGSFGKFSSTYRGLGVASKTLGRTATYIGTPLSIGMDYSAYRSGDISLGRFGYRAGSLGASIGTGAAIGGPWGAAAGAAVGGISVGAEYIYDSFLVPLGNEIQYQIWNFENAVRNGWYPGR